MKKSVLVLEKKPNKWRNKPVVMDGIRFGSQLEADRYTELCRMQKAGLINGLEVHKRFPLVVDGIKVCVYESDFCYAVRGIVTVEDVKALDKRTGKHITTPMYKLKKNLMKACWGITVQEWPKE